jgi:iron only hydrogenase large subunit-like protein
MEKKTKQSKEPTRYMKIDNDLCNGCVICIKVCPTKAIRIREDQKAHIEGVCINCGECLRVCPRGAITPVMAEMEDLDAAQYGAVSASTVLYTQFGEDVIPNDVLLALRRMNLGYVHDEAYTNEIFNIALDLYIEEKREQKDSPWPLISPICPVVVRLVMYRFPTLLSHLPPLLTPREIVAREAKKRLSRKYGCSEEDIKVLNIAPCPAKLICKKGQESQEWSYLDAAIGINQIHEAVRQNILELEEDKVLHHSGGVGLGWGMSGGEIAGMECRGLAVSGLQETIRYLEKIEMGLLQDIDYIEFRTCTEGCLGGPFTVSDKYMAKYHLQRLIRTFGEEKRVKYDYVKKLYEDDWFFDEKRGKPSEVKNTKLSIREGIERQKKVEEIVKALPGKQCAICGYPDCRTFAEDLVAGKASIESCIYMENQNNKRESASEG